MAQKNKKNQPGVKKVKPIFVRGIRPSTIDWLRDQVNPDAPSIPAVVRDIVEEKKRNAKKAA